MTHVMRGVAPQSHWCGAAWPDTGIDRIPGGGGLQRVGGHHLFQARQWHRACVECIIDAAPKTVGVDLGLHDVVSLSTGEKTSNERFFAKDEKRLARAQRAHARKQKGSKHREKARCKVARIHGRIVDRRRDFLHKLTTGLIRDNQVVCFESLQVKHMLGNHMLAKAIADVGWGELIRQLQYKAAWYGRAVVAIDKWYPSSKRYSACGHLLDSLALDVPTGCATR